MVVIQIGAPYAVALSRLAGGVQWASMSQAPGTRRRFSLLTLFVVVTVAAVWLAHTLNRASERERFLLHELNAEGEGGRTISGTGHPREIAAPWQLEVLSFGGRVGIQGCVPVRAIYLGTDDPSALIHRARTLFPEAEIILVPGP